MSLSSLSREEKVYHIVLYNKKPISQDFESDLLNETETMLAHIFYFIITIIM